MHELYFSDIVYKVEILLVGLILENTHIKHIMALPENMFKSTQDF